MILFKFIFSHDSYWFGFPNLKLLWAPDVLHGPTFSHLMFMSHRSPVQPYQLLAVPQEFPVCSGLGSPHMQFLCLEQSFPLFLFLAQDRPLGLNPLLPFNPVLPSWRTSHLLLIWPMPGTLWIRPCLPSPLHPEPLKSFLTRTRSAWMRVWSFSPSILRGLFSPSCEF